MMTRRHFEKIAQTLWVFRYSMDSEIHKILVDEFADLLATENPNFDRDRFIRACEVQAAL